MNYFQSLISKSKGNVYIIAEACDNHMGSYDIAIALVDAAVYAGADAVKFQHHLAYEEMLEDSPMSDNFSEPLYDFLNRNSLTLEQHKNLKCYCDSKNITYLCTPFSYKAAEEIKDIVPFFKIGSGEFQDRYFIDKLALINKPTLFSSGMSTYDEITENINYLKNLNIDFALMNCLSEYPPIFDDLNLKFVEKLKKYYPEIIIGHSDHTNGNFSSIVAASFGADIIEKHLTLSNFIPGPDRSVSILPEELKRLVADLRNLKATLGEEKIIHIKEKDIRTWAYRSVVSRRNLNEGEIIKIDDICTKRPGTGFPSKRYKEIIGKKVRNPIKINTIIKWEDLIE